jgi:hypothetical protein
MELSVIVKEYNVPLTRTEGNLVSQLGTGASALSEDRYKQQMKGLAAAREVVKQLPNRQTSERQSKMARAAMLKERLKILRQMIPFLSPSAAKSLKAEMQQIAAQIAALGGGSGGGSGGSMKATEMPAEESFETGSEAKTPQDAAVQPTETAREAGEAGRERPEASDGTAQGHTSKSSNSATDDRQLKEAVEELKSLYKAVMAALKRKQQAGRGGGHQADSSPALRIYAANTDSTSGIALKA